MEAFNYLAVLISIILGLGITQLLSGLGRLLQARAHVRPYWPTLIWVGLLLLLHVQTWWAMFGLRGVPEWSFAAFCIVLLQPIVLYMLSALVLPEANPDLHAHYFAHTRWFFGLGVLLLLVSLARDLILTGHLPSAINVGAHLVLLALWGSAAVSRREPLHRAVAVVSAVVLVAYIAALFPHLP